MHNEYDKVKQGKKITIVIMVNVWLLCNNSPDHKQALTMKHMKGAEGVSDSMQKINK